MDAYWKPFESGDMASHDSQMLNLPLPKDVHREVPVTGWKFSLRIMRYA